MKMKLYTRVLTRLFTPLGIFVKYLKESSRLLNDNLWNVIAVNVMFGLIVTISLTAVMFLVFELSPIRSVQIVLLGYLHLPITCYFVVGLLRFYVAIARKQPASFTLLFKGSKKYFHMLVLFMIYYTLYVLLVKIIADFKFYEGIIQIRLLVGFFFFFWLLVRFFYAPLFVIVYDNCTPRQAMRSSFVITSGRMLKTFILILFFLGVFISGLAFFVVGVAYTFGLSMIIFVMAYDIILKNEFSLRKKLINEVAVKTKKNVDQVTTKTFKNIDDIAIKTFKNIDGVAVKTFKNIDDVAAKTFRNIDEVTTKTFKNITHLLPKDLSEEDDEKIEEAPTTTENKKDETNQEKQPSVKSSKESPKKEQKKT